jgi:NAD(P)-dependent dehydrogenase (short-subunit alcohol dehydrogenase family)
MASSVNGNGRLAGKVVLVAGASSGMGRATALACAVEGADVGLIARRREPLNEIARLVASQGRRAAVCAADLTDPTATEAAFASAVAELGAIDIVVITAGTNIRQRALSVLSQEGWQEVLDGNVETAFQVTRAAVPRLRGRGGRIIYVSSLAVQRPDVSGVAYQVAKHAVVGLAHGTMAEEKANGIRTTVIFPGLTDTPLILKRPTPTPPDVLAKALQPEDVAMACVFIASLPSRANVPELQLAPAELYS